MRGNFRMNILHISDLHFGEPYLPAVGEAGKPLRPVTGGGDRPMFAHLKLRAAPIDANALDTSPAIAARSRRDLRTGLHPPGEPRARLGP